MSILLDLSKCSQEQLDLVDRELHLTLQQKSKTNLPPVTIQIQPYRVHEHMAFIPFAYGVEKGFKPMSHHKNTQAMVFKGVLREEQKEVRNEALEHLNRSGSVIISTHVGFGKSILATYFAYKIQMKTLIIVNRVMLIKQWTEVLHQFIQEPKVTTIKPNQVIDWDCDFFIVNAINVCKLGYMPEIGLVIVDEVHMIMSKVLSTCFQYLTPTYMIGLSATPYRLDGLDILFDLYFGKQRVDRQLNRPHTVYKVLTKFVPTVQRQNNGKIDWNDMLNQQALSEERNDLIVEIVLNHPELKFMILCKRIEQIKILQYKFEQKGIEAEYIYGDRQPNTQQQNRILIGTTQKLGTGFDAPWLNALLVASDLEAYFIQYLGRVFRKREVEPVIFDLVDQHSVFQKHYKTREQTYLKHGGKILKVKRKNT
jgi:superfamily II DNA or RNA helicase